MREAKRFGKAMEKAPERALPEGEFIIKRRMHLAVVLGITFCVIGGAVVASSFLLDWVVRSPGNESLWDLADRGGIYYLTVLVPPAGVLVAILSAFVALAQRGWRRFHGPMSVGAMAIAMLIIVSLALIALQIDADFVGPVDASFGPAMFMSVFGGVLAASGGIILTMDYLEDRARRGRFSASGGSPLLRTALRPAPKAKPRSPRQDKAARGPEAMPPTTDGAMEAFDEERQRLACPNCNSPIQSSWRICPICGEELQ